MRRQNGMGGFSLFIALYGSTRYHGRATAGWRHTFHLGPQVVNYWNHPETGEEKMRTRIIVNRTMAPLLGTVISLATCTALAEDAATNSRDAREAVLTANEHFYAALNAMFVGNLTPMESVWSHADDVTYLSPTGEQLTGWEAVRKSWQIQADIKLGGKVESRDVQIVMLSPTLALVTNREVGENPNTPRGPMSVDIRSSKIFRLEAGEWKLFFDHVDVLPLLTAQAT
jgi:ketosteroid isomerase-like protein